MRPRRRKVRILVPVVSMGDIAFLLIIFFMVCSNFAKEASIQLTPPRAIDLAKIEESGTSVSINEEGRIYVDGEPVGDADDVKIELTKKLAGRETDKGKIVLFKCDQAVGSRVFEPVLDAIASAGGIIAAVGEVGVAKQP